MMALKKKEQSTIKHFEDNASVDRNNSSRTTNEGFIASVGWDAASGLGVPNGIAFSALFVSANDLTLKT